MRGGGIIWIFAFSALARIARGGLCLSRASSCPLCIAGFFRDSNGQDCLECPSGTLCNEDGLSFQETLLLAEGFWRISEASTVIHECPLLDACVGGSLFVNEGNGYCREGYMGPMCAVCDPTTHYFNPDNLSCDLCKGGEQNRRLFIPLCAGMFFLVAVIGGTIYFGDQKQLAQLAQEAAGADLSTKRSEKMVLSMMLGMFNIRIFFKKQQTKVRVLTAFMQIAVNIGFNCSITFPLTYEHVLSFLTFVNLEIVPFLGLQCWFVEFDYIDGMMTTTMFPLAIGGILMVAYFIADRYGGGYRARSIAPLKRELKNDVPAALTKVFSLQETTEYLRIFSFVDIRYRGSLSKDDISKAVMMITGKKMTGQEQNAIFKDAKDALETFVEAQKVHDEKRGKAVKTKQKRKNWFAGDRLSLGEFLALMHRVFHLGLESPLKDPLERIGAKVNILRGQTIFYLFLLLSFLVLVGTSTTIFNFFKCHDFPEADDGTERYMYKDYSVDCNRLRYKSHVPYAVFCIFIYPVGIPLLYATLLWGHRVTLSSSSAMQREYDHDYPTVGHLTFLVESYKPGYYYFEVVECVRRLGLASLIGIADAESAAGATMGILICYVFIYVFTEMKPYATKEDNQLAVILAYSLALLFLAALLIKVNASDDSLSEQSVFSSLLIAVLFAGPVSIVVQNVYYLAEDQPDKRNKYDADGNLRSPTHFRTWFKRVSVAILFAIGLFYAYFSAVWGLIKAILGPYWAVLVQRTKPCWDTFSSKFDAVWAVTVKPCVERLSECKKSAGMKIAALANSAVSFKQRIVSSVISFRAPKKVEVKTAREFHNEKRESLRKEKEVRREARKLARSGSTKGAEDEGDIESPKKKNSFWVSDTQNLKSVNPNEGKSSKQIKAEEVQRKRQERQASRMASRKARKAGRAGSFDGIDAASIIADEDVQVLPKKKSSFAGYSSFKQSGGNTASARGTEREAKQVMHRSSSSRIEAI